MRMWQVSNLVHVYSSVIKYKLILYLWPGSLWHTAMALMFLHERLVGSVFSNFFISSSCLLQRQEIITYGHVLYFWAHIPITALVGSTILKFYNWIRNYQYDRGRKDIIEYQIVFLLFAINFHFFVKLCILMISFKVLAKFPIHADFTGAGDNSIIFAAWPVHYGPQWRRSWLAGASG